MCVCVWGGHEGSPHFGIYLSEPCAHDLHAEHPGLAVGCCSSVFELWNVAQLLRNSCAPDVTALMNQALIPLPLGLSLFKPKTLFNSWVTLRSS